MDGYSVIHLIFRVLWVMADEKKDEANTDLFPTPITRSLRFKKAKCSQTLSELITRFLISYVILFVCKCIESNLV